MTDPEVLVTIRRRFDSLFPMPCPKCGRQFPTLRDYMLGTRRLGRAISFDAEEGAWDTAAPVGTLALANCLCGTTLALSTQGMLLSERLALLQWLKEEAVRRGIRASDLLESVGDELRRQVLGEAKE